MANSGLREYHRKRNFTRTAEPRGKLRRRTGDLFVVHKHDARRRHYDLRLELDGVLKSWAVTRGPSLSPADKRLAVRTEDHPLDYAEFKGRIPEGEYGAGSIIVWDRGRWSTEGDPHDQLAKGHLAVDLHGSKLKGRWHLVHMKGRDKGSKENWLLIKADDEHAVASGSAALLEAEPRSIKTGRTVEDVARSEVKIKPKRERKANGRPRAKALAAEPGSQREKTPARAPPQKVKGGRRATLPGFIEPQLATLTNKPPTGDAWVHEVKFDGYRLLARIDRGRVTLKTRSGLDWTTKFSGVKKALETLPITSTMLDGEVVVETERGTPDFAGLQADLSEGRSDRFHYYLFDLLHLDGTDLTAATLLDRKKALAQLLSGHEGVLKYSEHFGERGDTILAHACRMGLEGIVSKLKDSRALSCGRSKAWLKTKCVEGSEFVIIGFVPSTTQRRAIGSLVLGYYRKGKLEYAGRVGSGYSSRVAEDLWHRLEAIRVAGPPLEKAPPADVRRNVRWTKPALVADVEIRGWTADNIVRQAVFKGLRQDKPAAEVVQERLTVKAAATPELPGAAHSPRPRAMA